MNQNNSMHNHRQLFVLLRTHNISEYRIQSKCFSFSILWISQTSLKPNLKKNVKSWRQLLRISFVNFSSGSDCQRELLRLKRRLEKKLFVWKITIFYYFSYHVTELKFFVIRFISVCNFNCREKAVRCGSSTIFISRDKIIHAIESLKFISAVF